MPSPYLTRRLRSYEEVNAAKDERRAEKGQIRGAWQAVLPDCGGAGSREPAGGERQAA